MRISRGPEVIRRCNSPAAVGGDFHRKYVYNQPEDAQDSSQERNIDLGGSKSAPRPRRVAKNDILQNPSEDVTFKRFRTVRQTLRPQMNESSAADSSLLSRLNTYISGNGGASGITVGNANGFPTGACCVRPLLRLPPAAAE